MKSGDPISAYQVVLTSSRISSIHPENGSRYDVETTWYVEHREGKYVEHRRRETSGGAIEFEVFAVVKMS